MGKQIKIVHVVGARPNFVKIASVLRACNKTPEIHSLLVHTGQHYTNEMDKVFFDALQIPAPILISKWAREHMLSRPPKL